MTDLQKRLQLALQKKKEISTEALLTEALEVLPEYLSTLKGEKGDQGERGEQGVEGRTGIQGERGERGERGEKGERGERGLEGKAGRQGERGNRGEKGEKGERGERGFPGADGEPGSPDSAEDIKKKIESLRGENRVDAKAIKNLPSVIRELPSIFPVRSQPQPIPEYLRTASITFVIDGGGSAITTGTKGFLEIPYSCTIESATLLADQSGSIVVDVWVDSYGNYPPTDSDSITASAPPTISSSTKSQDTTLTGWTKGVSEGAIMGFNVDSATTIQKATLSLKVRKV